MIGGWLGGSSKAMESDLGVGHVSFRRHRKGSHINNCYGLRFSDNRKIKSVKHEVTKETGINNAKKM